MMMETENIERYVSDLLEALDICRNDEAMQPLRLLLHHLYSAVAMYEQMDDEEKKLIAYMQEKLRNYFTEKYNLKERRRNKKKESLPPAPPTKEKAKKEKAEKNPPTAHDAQEAFRKECQYLAGVYDQQQVNAFYAHWTQKSPKTGRMMFEDEKYWNTETRLKRWVRNQYSVADTAAALRLERLQKRLANENAAAEQQRRLAAMREQADAQREQETEENRKGQMLTDEYIREHPDSLMARIAREREEREARKRNK